MARRAWPRTAITLLLAVVALGTLIAINELGFLRSTAALSEITNAARTRGALNRAMQLVLDAETGSRGFLLTGEPKYLEPYERAVAEIGEHLDELRSVYAGQPQARATLVEISREVQRKLAEMDLLVRMRQQGNDDAWKFVLMTDMGMRHMDAIRTQVAELVDTATARIEASQEQVRRSLLLARVGIGLVAFVALFAFYMYLRQTNALKAAGERQQDALQAERDLLEQQVRERTASLRELATHLQQVREQERGHLARELHDELGALLTAAKLDVARLKSRLGTPAPEVSQRLQHLTDTLNSGIALKRRIIEDLRPSSLTNLGLSSSLEILAREFSEQAGVEVATSLEPVELDEARQLTAYRLVQESLTNVAKYAQARHVEVSVHAYTNVVEVSVRDDGQGFDVGGIRPSTHGLAGMRHRVEAAGGRLTVTSERGKGTRVLAVLPQTPEAKPLQAPTASS
ncbi:CHASE3 domain-containing protein [Ramlibacter rhizophilus]|uniref:Histidine kinase n=1 Tax=Ramlibacter rhizophilus TaxID=1781167 RepID=A0A4Z0BST5_9BURK|nr:CHASE3 domain-containing protein [Ramlibacter rhizophilus]TFZ01490.1 histidine kinase [Ramlibacter rhizophilus]